MTDLIQEIEKAIASEALKHKEVTKNNFEQLIAYYKFIAGASFILPLLKKLLIQRDDAIWNRYKLNPDYEKVFFADELATIMDGELLKLLGDK